MISLKNRWVRLKGENALMKKAIAILLLCAVAVAGVFAAAELKFQPARVFDSISLHSGFDMFTSSVRAYDFLHNPYDIKSEAMGVSAGISLLIDFSEIPDFLKEGWYGYNDIEVFFPEKIVIKDTAYNKESGYSRLGLKTRMGIVRKADFGIPVKFYFGAGFTYGKAIAWVKSDESETSTSAQAFGAGLLTRVEYPFSDHFAVSVSMNYDLTFLSRVVEIDNRYRGTETISRHTSFGFGYGFSAMAGVKYIF